MHWDINIYYMLNALHITSSFMLMQCPILTDLFETVILLLDVSFSKIQICCFFFCFFLTVGILQLKLFSYFLWLRKHAGYFRNHLIMYKSESHMFKSQVPTIKSKASLKSQYKKIKRVKSNQWLTSSKSNQVLIRVKSSHSIKQEQIYFCHTTLFLFPQKLTLIIITF